MIDIVGRILTREGGDKFTNHSFDRGGPTKWGITLAAWSDFTEKPATISDIQSITEQEARDFYFTVHIARPRFDSIGDPELRDFVVDCGVNHGVSRASKWLQKAVGVAEDGVVGSVTLAKVNASYPLAVLLRMIATRQRFYAKIASDQLPTDPDLPNLQGWINRGAAFLDEVAARLAGG